MANPNPRHEAYADVEAMAKKTGETYQIAERPGEGGATVVYAVGADGSPLTKRVPQPNGSYKVVPIESPYRSCGPCEASPLIS